MAGFTITSRGLTTSRGFVVEPGNLPYVVCNGNTDAGVAAAIGSLPLVSHPLLGNIRWGTVILQPRTYKFSNPVTLPSFVTIDGLQRAICTRAGGYNGLLFTNASAIQQFALNGIIWDNAGTGNFMWKFPVGCTEFEQIWARYQNLTSTPLEFIGAGSNVAPSARLTFRDIRFACVGSPANAGGIFLVDVEDVTIEDVRTYPDVANGGTTTINAVDITTTGAITTTLRNFDIRGIEAEQANETVVLVRPWGGSTMENITVKSVRGETIGSAAIQKGLVDVGEQVGGTNGTSATSGITVEDVHGRDWFGNLVIVGGPANGGVVSDFTVADVRGDCSVAGTGVVDTTRGSIGVQISGAQNGELDGIVIRNTGRAGLRFISSGTSQRPSAHITAKNIHIESCVQNPSLSGPATWQETGILFDQYCSDIYVEGRSINNYSAVNTGGGSAGAGVGCLTGGGGQANNIKLRVVCTDNRGTQFQDVGVRIGQGDTDANQPNNWDILPGSDLSGNLTAPIYGFPLAAFPYASSDHGHRLRNVRGVNDYPWTYGGSAVGADGAEGQPGLYCPIGIAYATGTVSAAAATNYFVRGYTHQAVTINKVVFAVTTVEGTAGNDGVVVAIYSGAGTSLLGSSVSTTGVLNSTGAHAISLQAGVTLTPESAFYVGLIMPATLAGTAPVLVAASFSSGFYPTFFGSLAPSGYVVSAAGTGSAPASMPTTGLASVSTIPILAARS